MGRLSVKLLQVNAIHASMGTFVKGSKALKLIVTLEANGSALAAPATLCEKFPAKDVLSSQKPLVLSGNELTLDAARFSARLVVALLPSTASTTSLAEAVLTLEHCVRGRARRVKVNLYQSPANRLSEDLPLSAAIAELTMELTAADFGDDAAVVDEANRTEQEQPLIERLRCYLTAYNPSELRTLDETVLRYRRLGWEAQLAAFLRQHNNAAEPVVGKLQVTVRGGKEFPKEGSSYVDPYVVVSLNGTSGFGDSFQTPVVNSANTPQWNTTGTLRTLFGSNEVLQFRCFDYDMLSDDDLIGETILLPLALAVRGRTMKRTLFVTKNVCYLPTTIDVEVTPLDFGLDPSVYETLVESIEANELPRLQEYYKNRFVDRLPSLETDLAQHALTPGSFERYMESLVPIHGLEPRNSNVKVVLQSLQQAVHPRRHIAMDLSRVGKSSADSPSEAPAGTTAATTAAPPPTATWHPVALVATLNQSEHVPRTADDSVTLKVTQAQAQRVTFAQGEGSNAVMTTHCFFPQKDCVTLRVYFREQHHHVTYNPLGSVDLCLSKLWKGIPKTRTHALLIQEDTAEPRITGFVTVTITADHFGRTAATLQAATELAALEDERENAQLPRLRGMLRRYEPRELRRTDAIISTALDVDAHLLALEKKYGPPPGALQLELTIVGCRDLPRLEITGTGLDPYVTVVTREASVATPVAKVNVLNPDFPRETSTFLLDVINPDRDSITITVMDYDSNSEDDVVSSVIIPLRSLACTTRTLRWLPLISSRIAALKQVEGKIGIEFRSIGFGSADEAVVASEVSASIRPRVIAVLNRFAQQLLPQYETLLWKHGSDRFPRALEDLIAAHGPEPGTYRVVVQVKRCTNLPKIELTGGDPYVAVSCQSVGGRTKELPSELNPVWVDAVIDLDLPKPGAFDTANIDVLVWDRDKNSDDDVWCRLVLPLSSYGSTETSVTLPLIPEDLSKIRSPLTALSELPSITLSIRTIGFVGSKWNTAGAPQAAESAANADRLRIIRHLLRHSPQDLSRYDVLRVDSRGIDAVLAQFGLEAGQGLVQLTICSAELLKRKGQMAKKGNIYVTLRPTDEAATLCMQTKKQTSTLPYKEGSAVQWNQTFNFDVAKKTTEFLLDVYDDVTGSDYCYGTVRISLARLQREVVKRRIHPILHHHESGEYAGRVSVSGYLTTELISSVLGRQEPYNDDEDIALLKRIRALLLRFAPREVDAVDRISTPLASTLDTLIARYGPEPGTYRVQLTILACRDLPCVDLIGGIDPYVTISCGSAEVQQTKRLASTQDPQFNETFTIDVVSTVKDDVVLTVMDYDRNSDDDEVCRVVIPLRSLSAHPVKRWLPLAPASSDVPCRGSIGFEAHCIGFDPSQTLPESLKSVSEAEVEAQRDRLVRMYVQYTKSIPYKYECDLWAGKRLDEPIAKLIQRYGPEPGSRTAIVTLHSIEGLLDKKGEPVKKANLYVKVLCGDEELAETKPVAISATTTTGSTSKFVLDGKTPSTTTMSMTVDLPFDPQSAQHHVILRVMNDVVGFDEAFGECAVSFRIQERGQPKRRVLPLVRIDRPEDDSNTSKFSLQKLGKTVGYVELTTFSDRFGSATATELQDEARFRQRVQAVLQRHRHIRLRDLEAEMNAALTDQAREEYLAKLSTSVGVGPGTYKMRIAINGGPVLTSDAPSLPPPGTAGSAAKAQLWEYSVHPHEPWGATTTIVQQTPTSFEVDLTDGESERVIICCALREAGSSGPPSLVLLAAAPASLISTDGNPTTRELTLLSPLKPPPSPLSVDSIVGPFRTGTGDLPLMKIAGSLCVTVVDGGGSVVAGTHPVVSTPEQIALEDSYRARLWKLFSTRYAARLLLVDGSALGLTKDELERSMAQWISDLGQEDGAVWIQVDVLSMSLLESASTTSLYTKVYLNGLPISKALAAQVPHAGKGTKTDVRFPLTDDLHVKLATKGLLGTTVVGRAVLPVRLIREATAAPTPPHDSEAAESVDVCVWIFDDEKKKQVVGDVVVRIHHRGLPFQPPHVAVQPPSKRWLSAYFRDYCLARRTVGYDSHEQVASFRCLNQLWDSSGFYSNSSPQLDVVYLHVVGCRGLPRMDTFGTSDTFVRVENTILSDFRTAAQTTRVVGGTLDPNFYFHRDDAIAVFVTPGDTSTEDKARKNELCLEVRDEDSASSELIGKVFLLPKALDSGWWDVGEESLAPFEGPMDASARAAWISQNEGRLLRVPIVLQHDNGTAEGRGELLLCTSRRPTISNANVAPLPTGQPEGVAALGVAGAAAALPPPERLKQVYSTASAILRKNKMWNDLEHLHSFVFRKVQRIAEALRRATGGNLETDWRQVTEIFLLDLKKEYGDA